MAAILAAAGGLALALGVTWHEWAYHQHHPGRTGVSGVFVALGLAVAAGCLSTLLIAWKGWSEETREQQEWLRRVQELHERNLSEEDESDD